MPRFRSLAATALAVALLTGLPACSSDIDDAPGGALGGTAPEVVDRSKPEDTALAFIRFFAVNDRRMCELADWQLADKLNRDGRCGLPVSGPPPQLTITSRRFCPPPSPSFSSYKAEVSPPGMWGQRYASASVAYEGTQWVVKRTDSYAGSGETPKANPNTVVPDSCKPPENNYGSGSGHGFGN